MLLGKISDKTTTKEFNFIAEARVKKLQYVTVKDPEGHWTLGYIDNIVRYKVDSVATVSVIGFRDSRGFLKTPAIPFEPDTPIYAADEDIIREVLGIEDKGLYVGILEGYNLKVNLPIKHIITKHLAVLAKTGAGKSYAVGVLLEELVENEVPVVVIDPHGEYSTLAKKNDRKEELKFAERFDIEPKDYKKNIQQYGIGIGNPIRLDSKLSAQEIVDIIRLTNSQKTLLYSAVKNLKDDYYTLKDIMVEVEQSNSQARWGLLSNLEMLTDMKIFSANPTKVTDLVKKGKISIIDLKEGRPEVQKIIVFKLLEELFEARKRNKIPEFLLVVEEAHNFAPERGFGKAPSTNILRTIATEGRKFGMGLAIVTQRPARVDKSVLSQCNTQIILKVTNPNDLKAITESVEGVTHGLKEEIKDLPVGVAIVVGVAENPLLVDIRIRRTKHGGEAIVLERNSEETLLFLPKVSEKEILEQYKGIHEPQILQYPLWRLEAKYRNRIFEAFIDGVTGELLYKKDDYVYRTENLYKLLHLESIERKIMFHVIIERITSPEKLSEDLEIPLNIVNKSLKKLEDNGFVDMDEGLVKNNIGLELLIKPFSLSLNEKPETKNLSGVVIEFQVSDAIVKKLADLWEVEIKSINPVFYPYWIIHHKDKKVLIDALTKSIDFTVSESINL